MKQLITKQKNNFTEEYIFGLLFDSLQVVRPAYCVHPERARLERPRAAPIPTFSAPRPASVVRRSGQATRKSKSLRYVCAAPLLYM